VIATDPRLQVLHVLLRHAEGDAVDRVQDAIRQHQRALEREQVELERQTLFGPAPTYSDRTTASRRG
jgi:hypothetical protein